MGSIIKLGSNPAKLGIPGSSREHIKTTDNLMGIRVRHGRIVRVGGKEDGTVVTDSIVEANQQVLIYPVIPLEPKKYQTLISINAAILQHGMVSHPTILEPGEGSNICVAFKAGRKCDLSTIDYLFILYMID